MPTKEQIQMVLQHIDVINESVAQIHAMINGQQPIGLAIVEEKMVSMRDVVTLERLQTIRLSTWACKDLLEHME
jgi:hypothetical protein